MKASDYITHFFIKQGVECIFGYQGGMITDIIDSVEKQKDKIKFIQTYHEQTAAFSASGYATATENIGVAIATSGPGATNLITGIGDAFYDSIPVIFITGQVNTYEQKNNLPIRQLGFQEADIVSMVKPITKFAIQVTQAIDLPQILAHAVEVALSGRKGPVLIDIPLNLQREEINAIPQKINSINRYHLSKENIDWVISKIENAKSPMFLLGGGAKASITKNLLHSFLKKYSFPFVYSLRGKGIISDDNPLNLGMIGSYGVRCAHIAISNSDVIIVLGSRLDTRQTGANTASFCPNATIIHVDIDENELIYSRIKNRYNICCHIEQFINGLMQHMDNSFKTFSSEFFNQWIAFCTSIKTNFNQQQEIKNLPCNITPYLCMQQIQKISPTKNIYIADVGQHQMWAAQMLQIMPEQDFFTSAGFGAMGFSIPFAIGYAFATHKKIPITVICGDGGFHISIQSLMLIDQYELPIKIMLFNNLSLGMITQFQDLYFNKVFTGTKQNGGYLVPNIKACAEMYNLPYETVDAKQNISFKNIKDYKNGIFNIVVGDDTFVYPKLEFDKTFDNPSPYLDEKNIPKFLS